MIGRRIVASKDVSLAEVAEILSQVTEEELGFEQSKTREYTKKFSKLEKKDSDDMIKDLMQNSKVSRSKAVKIIDLMPSNAVAVKALFAKETFSFSDEEVTWVLGVVKDYSKKIKESAIDENEEKKEKKEKKESKEKPESKE